MSSLFLVLNTHTHSLSLSLSLQILATFSLFYVNDRSAEYKRYMWFEGGDPAIKSLIQYGYTEERDDNILWFSSPQLGGLDMAYPLRGWSHIDIPGNS